MCSYCKYFIFLLVLSIGFVSRGFSYYQNKMYCDISKDRVIISLDNKKVYTCDVYVRYIETQMKKVYNDILTIQKYIDKKQDLGYWNPLKDEKVTRLKLLQNMRLNILSHVETFEKNLFEKAKTYFINSIDDYKKKIIKSINTFGNFDDYASIKYVSMLKKQLDNIDKISKSTTFDELDKYIENYVYLKKQIEGK